MTVFVLGAGVMQLPALDCARELGWRVAAADGNPAAPGAGRCDRFFAVDLKDRAGLLAACRELRAEGGLEAVFTAGTDFSANVAWLAAELGLPGHAPEAALAASDKLLMRERFAAAGLPSPRFAECRDPAAFLASPELEGLGFPLVVKPADNMGARGCRLVRDRRELALALAQALPLSRSSRAIVEEYVEGPEFSVDALVHGGRIDIRGFADRRISFSPFFVELGHSLPSRVDPAVEAEVLEVFKAGVRVLGLSHGAAKGDMKWSPARGGPVIGEIAARLSGGYMSGWTYPYASGLDLTREALLLAAGLSPREGEGERGWSSAERAFISIPGRVARIEGLREARNSPYIKDLFLRCAPGDEVVFPSNNVEKCGNLIAQAPEPGLADASAEAAARRILIRLEAPWAATTAFLRGEGREEGLDGLSWPPPAFDAGEELRRTLEGLAEGSLLSPAEGRELLVLPLPDQGAPGLRDWAGRSLGEAAEEALRAGGGRWARAGEAADVGRAFWKALLVGGVQGGLYVLDCLRGGAALP